MRIKIKEALDNYNAIHKENKSMSDLALGAYAGLDILDQSKINRISMLNSGKKTATVNDLVRISEYLNISPTDLIK